MSKKGNDIRDIFLEGKVMWAKVLEPQSSPKSRGVKSYSIDIEVDDKKIKGLKKAGVAIGNDKYDKKIKTVDGVIYLPIKRKELNKSGDPVGKLTVIGKDLKPFTDLIGNGSVCKIKVSLIPIEDQTLMYLKAVQVIEHVPFEGGGNDLEGFEATEEADDLSGFGSDTDSEDDDEDDLI